MRAEGGGDDRAFATYLASLAGSWEALATGREDARVVRGDGFLAACFPDAVLNNAVVLDAAALPAVEQLYEGAPSYAIWTHQDDDSMTGALEAASYRRDTTTCPMICRLADVKMPERSEVQVRSGVDPALVAALSGVRPELFRDVPGLTAVVSGDLHCGLVAIDVGTDVSISAVVTHPEHRGRGLASAVTARALADAGERSRDTATLQATPVAERLYRRLGFRPLGRWQEWVRRL